jgi:hypothetical protein
MPPWSGAFRKCGVRVRSLVRPWTHKANVRYVDSLRKNITAELCCQKFGVGIQTMLECRRHVKSTFNGYSNDSRFQIPLTTHTQRVSPVSLHLREIVTMLGIAHDQRDLRLVTQDLLARNRRCDRHVHVGINVQCHQRNRVTSGRTHVGTCMSLGLPEGQP